MTPMRLVATALLLGAVGYAAHAQPPSYGPRTSSPPYDDERYGGEGYDDWAPTPEADVGFFYDELSPYGDWVRTRDYGWAWFPRDVHAYWRPYRDGRWVSTEHGWTWVSYEPFGWATYHYGRWARDSRFGWLWIPGTIWGPAWVSWQHGGGYVGWAPLPPSVGFEVDFGIRLGGLDLAIGIRPDTYSFVSERSFLEPRLSGYLVPTVRNVTLIHSTTNITNYTYVNNRVINRGVDVRRIEEATGRRVRPRRVAGSATRSRTEVAETEIRIYRPERRRLDTVHVGRRANAGLRAETPPAAPERERTATDRRDRRNAPEVVVAPRSERSPRADARQLERQDRREQQELEQYQAAEKRKVEKLQREESAKVAVEAERGNVQQRHKAEREALEQATRDASQQLQARQKAKREAALAEPPAVPPPQGRGRNADPEEEKKKREKKEKEKKGKDNGEGEPRDNG